MVATEFFAEFVAMRFAETNDASNVGTQLGEFVVACVLTLFVAVPIALAGLAFATLAAVRMTSQFMTANPINEGEAVKLAQQNLGKMVITLLLVTLRSLWVVLAAACVLGVGGLASQMAPADSPLAGLIAFFGILGLIVGALIFIQLLSRYALIAPITILEGLPPKQAMARSFQLMRRDGPIVNGYGNAWAILFLSLFFYFVINIGFLLAIETIGLVAFLKGIFSVGAAEPIFEIFIYAVPNFIALLLTLPFPATALTILYYDRCVRTEGYDIDALNADALAALPRRR